MDGGTTESYASSTEKTKQTKVETKSETKSQTKKETKTEEKEEVKTCTGVNEELGADKISCVCKYGYEKVNGVCKEKQKVTCSENEELGADGITCIKKNTEDNNKDEELNNSEE